MMQERLPYLVLRNFEGQFSLWPAEKPLPTGWRVAMRSSSEPECLGYIRRVWTDMRPVSLRRQMDGGHDNRRVSADGDTGPDRCVHEFLEDQVERTPDAVALVCGGRELSFTDLNTRANQLAHYFRGQGVGPETLVSVCLADPIEAIVASLAVLKAGGAYVPLDPDCPQARLRYMVEDSRSRFVLTETRLRRSFVGVDVQTVPLDQAWVDAARHPVENLGLTAELENAALVIYTSGSSGHPKAVIKTHRNVASRKGLDSFGPDAMVCNLMSLSYGFFAGRLLPTLGCGVPLVIIPPDRIQDLVHVAKTLESRSVTDVSTVPSLLQELLRLRPELLSRLSCIRNIEVGGDSLMPSLVDKVADRLPLARVRHGWGASEAGWAIVGDVSRAGSSRAVSVGRPVVNAQIFILDSDMEPVAPGQVGELYVASPQVVRGYLGRPDLTAQKFVPNPFGSVPGERMYRTGDRGSLLPNGEIALSERVDRMVKIRGFRVEPREIEATLSSHPAVSEAVVGVDGCDDQKQLVAYVVPETTGVVMPLQLRSFLAARVPDYLVPSAFVVKDRIPRNAHGKTDWSALLRPSENRRAASQCFVAPRNPTERKLTDIWSRLLRLERVGIRDNFFDQGGDSLLAARLTTEVGAAFSIDLPPSVLLQAPTIEKLAERVDRPEPSRLVGNLVPLETGGTRKPFFWLHGEASDSVLPKYLGPDQPLYGIPHQSEDGTPAANTTIEQMASANIGAIRTVQDQGPYLLGGYCFGGLVALEMAQQLRSAGEDVGLLVLVNPMTLEERGRRHDRGQTSLYSRVSRHSRNLRELGSAKWLPYLLTRAAGNLADLVTRAVRLTRKLVRTAACEVCLRLGYRLPPGLRSFYILNVYRRALKQYRVKPWPGRIVLFRGRSETRDPQAWRELAIGGLEVREIAGDHTSVLREPQVGSLARELGASLSRFGPNAGHQREPNVPVGAVREHVSI